MKHLYRMLKGTMIVGSAAIVLLILVSPPFLAEHYHNVNWWWLYSLVVLPYIYLMGCLE